MKIVQQAEGWKEYEVTDDDGNVVDVDKEMEKEIEDAPFGRHPYTNEAYTADEYDKFLPDDERMSLYYKGGHNDAQIEPWKV
jgi:hypothetical protein